MYDVEITFQVYPEHYHSGNTMNMESLVRAMIKGEADWPDLDTIDVNVAPHVVPWQMYFILGATAGAFFYGLVVSPILHWLGVI